MEDQGTEKRTTRFTRNKTEDISNLLYGKIPPSARELEEAVLGAILIEKDALIYVSDILTPETFYVDAHATIYRAMKALASVYSPIDLMTVTEKLRTEAKLEECGGAFFLSELTNKVASSANVEYHARIIYQKYIQREIIRISNDLIRDSYEDTTDVFDLLDQSMIRLSSLSVGDRMRQVVELNTVIEKIQRGLMAGEPIAEVIDLCIADLDTMKKTFNAVAGFQGTGKTAFILTAARKLSKQGKKVGIKSIEMSADMLGARYIQEETSYNAKKIISQKLTQHEKDTVLRLEEIAPNIFVDDNPYVTRSGIISEIVSFVMKHGIEVLFIDYLQMIDLEAVKINEVRAMELLCISLQNIAKHLNISIIGLSQLTKMFDKNGQLIRPSAKSLRGGGIEQSATDIWILFDEFEKEHQGLFWNKIPLMERGKLKCITAKGRHSETGDRDIFFNKPYQLMEAWDMHLAGEEYRNYTMEVIKFEEPKDDKKAQQFDIF